MRGLLLRVYRRLARLFAGRGLRRFRAVQALHVAVSRHLARGYVKVQGDTIFLDRIDTLGLAAYGTYDPVATGLVRRHLQTGDVVVDVGAHIGYYTLLFARVVGPAGHVFAFEPSPENFSTLQRNVAANGHANVTLIPKAVSKKRGHLLLYLSETNLGDHRIYDPGDEPRAVIEVESVALDQFFLTYSGAIDLVKLDIQGAELAALQGMTRLLEQFPTAKLLLEFWPLGLKEFGVEASALLELLEAQGFSLYDVNEVAKTVERRTATSLLRTYTVASKNATNLFCIRAPVR
jgi:FkbM family methyltransferase